MKNKKYLAFIFFTVFFILLFSLVVGAERESDTADKELAGDSGSCGDNVYWTFEGNTLTIYGEGPMYTDTSSYKEYREYGYLYKSIKNVIIEDGVTYIGYRAFYDFDYLENVTIPPSVKEIGNYAFYDCQKIKNVYISDVGAWCGIITKHDTSNPLVVGHNLYVNGEPATDLVIPEDVERIEYNAFKNCETIKSVTIPKSLKYIGQDAFANCTYLDAVYISDLSSWCEIEFYSYTSNPLNIAQDLYLNGELIEELVVPEGVTHVNDGAFVNNPNITSVILPQTISYVGDYAFRSCDKLNDAYIPDVNVTIGSYAFYDTPLFSNKANWYRNTFYIGNHLIYSTYDGDYDIPYGTKTIGIRAFATCYVDSLTIPNTVTHISERAFEGNYTLDSINIPESVTRINYNTFYYSNIKTVTLPETLTYIDEGAFGYTSIKSIVIPDSVVAIDRNAFSDCKHLKSISLGKGVERIGCKAFYNTLFYNTEANWDENCLYLDDWLIEIKDTSETITVGYGIKYIADSAFAKKSGDGVILPRTLEGIGNNAFERCLYESITIPVGVKEIGEYAFYNCKNLIALQLPHGITEIGDSAFRACTSLTAISVPEGTQSIGSNAFADCTSLIRVTIPESVTSIENDAFANTTSLTIYCYKGSYAEAYAVENSIPYTYVCEEHSFTDYHSNNDGSCEKNGTMTAFCDSGCGVSHTITEVSSTFHNYKSGVLRASTCKREGLGIFVCTECNTYYTVSLPIVGHSYTEYVFNNDENCTEDGTKTAYCDYGCNNSVTVIAQGTAAGHTFTGYIYNNDATCTANGTTTAYCSYGCGVSNTVTAVGTRFAHLYTSYTVNDDATCTSNATMTAYCDYGCGTKSVKSVPNTMKSHNYVLKSVTSATCTEPGRRYYACSTCGAKRSETYSSPQHTMGEWEVYIPATPTSTGESRRNCLYCDYYESALIPILAIPEVNVNGYGVLISKAHNISSVTYVLGEYSSSEDIKNIQGCITLNEEDIKLLTENNSVSVPIEEGGVYSFLIECLDGNDYVHRVDLAMMEQETESDGTALTVKNLYGVKDYFIAKGVYDNYSDLRANAIVQITKNKIGTKHDYTYLLKEGGTYTVCVRYEDSSRAIKFMTVELSLNEPVFTPNGLQLIIGNLKGVKVIRSAYGDYDTAGAIKRAAGNRAFTSKGVLSGLEEYAIQFREEGVATVAVVYNNGYEVVYKYNVTKKTPTLTLDGDLITIGNLDDFKVIRYAEGVYSTSSEIKNAKGSIGVSGKHYTYSSYTARLKPGITYTFCVQYNDESYNYYIVTVE